MQLSKERAEYHLNKKRIFSSLFIVIEIMDWICSPL